MYLTLLREIDFISAQNALAFNVLYAIITLKSKQ
jgi:hypothetical protein